MTRIFTIDDHPVIRMGLAGLIAGESDMELCGEAGSAAAALEHIRDAKPDLILLDLALPDSSGLELLKEIQATCPAARVLVLSSHDERTYAPRVLRAGARGYVMKEEATERLVRAVHTVTAGEIYVSERIAGAIIDIFSGNRKDTADPVACLTDRELEVFSLIGQGRSSKEIGGTLQINPRTVDAHRANIKRKLAINDAKTLLMEAVRWHENA
jgi:DNA-binding NarL/FixJ family response regulator